VALVPLFIEYFQLLKNLLHSLIRSHQVRNSEVVSARSLFKPTARYSHDARLVNHVHTVEEIRFLSLFFSLLDKLFREVNAGESIHSSFNLGAGHIGHRVESRGQHLRLVFEGTLQVVILLQILGHCILLFNADLWRVHH